MYYHTQSFFGLGTAGLQIKIHLTGSPETSNKIFYLRHRPSWKVRKNVFSALKSPSAYPTHAPAGMERVMAYDGYDCETEGEVNLIMPPGKKLDHNGIQVKFFGRIDMVSFRCSLWAEISCATFFVQPQVVLCILPTAFCWKSSLFGMLCCILATMRGRFLHTISIGPVLFFWEMMLCIIMLSYWQMN